MRLLQNRHDLKKALRAMITLGIMPVALAMTHLSTAKAADASDSKITSHSADELFNQLAQQPAPITSTVVPVAQPVTQALPAVTPALPTHENVMPAVNILSPVPEKITGHSADELFSQLTPQTTAHATTQGVQTMAQAPAVPLLVAQGSITPTAQITQNNPETAEADNAAKETLVTAQHMTSDQNTGIVTAQGKVEIVHAGYILHADTVTYNPKTSIVHAEGHVATLNPNGQVEFANEEEVTGDMKEAFAEKVGILFPDNSRLAANTAQRFDERWFVAKQALYTSCNVCKENPDQAPLWQVSADTITHDNVEHDIYYHNATIDFAGVPVLYTPYFSAPDPTVKRRQGFLTPTPGDTTNLGAFVRVPYYFDIAPDKDAVLAPTFSTEDKLQMSGDYRERFANGYVHADGSFTHADLIDDSGNDQGYKWRGNFSGTLLYNLNDTWRAGADVNTVTDKSYLQRYRLPSQDELVSRAYAERFSGRNYAAINSYYYQDLRPGIQAVEPFVLPQASFEEVGEPGQTLGGRWTLGGNTLVTHRNNSGDALAQQGPDTRRLSLNTGWERRFVSDTGIVTTTSALARTDNYSADNVIKTYADGTTATFNNVLLSREFVQGNVMSSYPMGMRGDGYQQILEPIVAFTAAPTVHTNDRQPIEDSLDLEYDDTNLFSPNRFTGSDLIEGGSRATAGVRETLITDEGMHASAFGGTSYNLDRNSIFPDGSGLATKVTDYVMRFDLAPTKWFGLNYGARLDEKTFQPESQDASISVGPDNLRLNTHYIEAFQTETTGVVDRVKDISLGFTTTFLKYWTLSGSHLQAFEPQPGPRTSALTVNYNDECFIAGVTLSENDTNRADLSSGTSVVFHFYLRNLGGLHTDSGGPTNFPTSFRTE